MQDRAIISTPATIRPARPDEAGILSEVAMTSKASRGYSKEFMEACREELTYSAEQIASARFVFFVAEIQGRVVGFSALESRSNILSELEALFVLPKESGRGIGTRLFRFAAETARQQGKTRLEIQSDPGAVAFYQSFGAAQIGMSPSRSIEGRKLPVLLLDLT